MTYLSKSSKINKLKIKKPFNYTSNKTKKFISKNELNYLNQSKLKKISSYNYNKQFMIKMIYYQSLGY